MLENLNLDFSSTASEEQFGEQEKPLRARIEITEPTRNFSFIILSFFLPQEAFFSEKGFVSCQLVIKLWNCMLTYSI